MDLEEFKAKTIQERTGIDLGEYSPIFSFIDFGNVNYWFENDNRDGDGNLLSEDKKLMIDLDKLYDFANVFSMSSRFYYGLNPKKRNSVGFIDAARHAFGKRKVITKPIQQIKHYLNDAEIKTNTRTSGFDQQGQFVKIPKCNFDVEICVDAMRLASQYKTFCLFSSDADFVRLFEYLKSQGKKIILIKGGYAQHYLVNSAHIVINAQEIKQYITAIKSKNLAVTLDLADRDPASAGRTANG
jgi:uncharacterized LabA/DUF88 family protein